MDINASHLLIAAASIVIGALAWSLWQQRATLTPAEALQKASTVSRLTQALYTDAVVVVQWLQQTTSPPPPDATPAEIAAINAEKKNLAFDVLERRGEELLGRDLTDDELAALDRLIEGVVYAVKALGGRVPQVRLVGEQELIERFGAGSGIPPQEM
jgi:hypothetical protein